MVLIMKVKLKLAIYVVGLIHHSKMYEKRRCRLIYFVWLHRFCC